MSYVIGTSMEYIKVYDGILQSEKEEKRIVFKVEYGLNLMENPTIFNDRNLADETLRLILEQKKDIKFENKNIFGKVIERDTLDVSELRVYQMILFDTNRNIIEQMKEMIGECDGLGCIEYQKAHKINHKIVSREFNNIGEKITIQLKYDDFEVTELPESCMHCPIGFMKRGCGRKFPLTEERPESCKLKLVKLLCE